MECKQMEVAALVQEYITGVDDPEAYLGTLDDMFDAWLQWPEELNYGLEYRATVLGHYRNMQQLLRKLQELGAVVSTRSTTGVSTRSTTGVSTGFRQAQPGSSTTGGITL